jgi:hypothetical protein
LPGEEKAHLVVALAERGNFMLYLIGLGFSLAGILQTLAQKLKVSRSAEGMMIHQNCKGFAYQIIKQ